MKPFGVLIFLSIIIIDHTNGQSKVDSLKGVLLTSLPDSVRIDVYLKLNTQIKNDTAVANKYLREAIALSIATNDQYRLSRCYLRQVAIYERNGNLTAARQTLLKVKRQLLVYSNDKVAANSSMYLGIIDYFRGSYDSAVHYLWEAVRLYEKLNDSVSVASCFINIGNCYKELEDYDNTVKYYQQAMDLYELQGYEAGVAMVAGNLGNVHKHFGAFTQALGFYQQSLAVHRRDGSQEDLRINLNNIGELYLEMKEWEKSLPYLQESLQISRAIHSETGIMSALLNIGLVDLENRSYKSALQKFHEVLKRARASHFQETVEEALKSLSVAYERMGKFDQALSFRKQYETVRDSLINNNYLSQVKELELKYETEKKDKQIAILEKEKELTAMEQERESAVRTFLIAGTVLIFVMALLVVLTYRQRLLLAARNTTIQEVKFKHQLSDLEMKALRAQINPHFMFNCLNSINRLIVKGDNESASLYLKKFSKLVRMILESTETNRVSLENELAMIEAYIQLEELRFKGKINYEISVDRLVEKENTFLPPMVLQPFVENAIWHGLNHQDAEKKGQIKIEVKEEHETLVCVIQDNGVGREKSGELKESDTVKTKSLGIKITEERLKLLSKERIRELIRIVDLKDAWNTATGTRVEITIPLS